MISASYVRKSILCLLTLLCSLLICPLVSAQKQPAVTSQAPTINPLAPMGVQPGQAIDIVVTGTNLAGATGAAISVPAKITIPTEDKNGQDAAKCKVRVEIPKDTPLGWYAFRFATLKGI